MLIPSIDLMNGRAVQLRNGRDFVLDCGDPRPILERFAPLGEVAIIDLDAAMGRGSNAALIRSLLPLARCRVGGGIRSLESARSWLDAGAERILIGTAAEPAFLRELPRERLIAAVDGTAADVLVEGWRRGAGETIEARVTRLRPFVGGFLVTFVETEGTLGGFDLARAERIARLADEARVTFAGGIVAAEEVTRLDRLGADAQIGMALYTGRLDPAEALWAVLVSDRPDGLVPTTVCDPSGRLLMLAYSDRESLAAALRERQGIYRSRQRGLWRKGATSGCTQRLRSIDVDCDRDALRFTVEQVGATCHTGTSTCFGPARGMAATIEAIGRAVDGHADERSYTRRLLGDAALLRAKLLEEASEFVEAETNAEVAAEAADLVYFALVRLASRGVPWSAVDEELDRRRRRISRRPGNAKEAMLP